MLSLIHKKANRVYPKNYLPKVRKTIFWLTTFMGHFLETFSSGWTHHKILRFDMIHCIFSPFQNLDLKHAQIAQKNKKTFINDPKK
jgi:hypothetical protein